MCPLAVSESVDTEQDQTPAPLADRRNAAGCLRDVFCTADAKFCGCRTVTCAVLSAKKRKQGKVVLHLTPHCQVGRKGDRIFMLIVVHMPGEHGLLTSTISPAVATILLMKTSFSNHCFSITPLGGWKMTMSPCCGPLSIAWNIAHVLPREILSAPVQRPFLQASQQCGRHSLSARSEG